MKLSEKWPELKQFEEENDASLNWWYLEFCKIEGLPEPDWAADFYQQVGRNLLKLDRENDDFRTLVLRAVGAKADRFNKIHKSKRDFWLFVFVTKLEREGCCRAEAYRIIMKEHPEVFNSTGSMRKAYDRFLKQWKSYRKQEGKIPP